jgi:diguanylate cyclase (GGDEF)-like protein/PAS domain S-box-containing protein
MKINKVKALFIFRWLVLIIAGLCYIIYTWTVGMNRTREQAIKLARIVESGFHYDDIAMLDVSSKDLYKDEYLELKSNLTRFAAINKDIRFAYIYTLRDGKIYFIADSEQEYSQDYSPPGQQYTEAGDIFYKAADDSGKVIISDTNDRWGTFVSVLVPIEEPKSGKTMAVFGMDYTPGNWYDYASQNTLLAVVVVTCLLLLFRATNIIIINNKELRKEKEKLAQTNEKLLNSERNNALLLMNLPGMAYRCRFDKNWTMEYVSDGSITLTGYAPEDLEYNRTISFNDLITGDYREAVWEQWTQIIKDKVLFSGEYSIKTAKGELKWVYESGQGIYDEQGNIDFVEGIIIDITDRKKRENEIKYLSNHDTLTGLYNRRFFEDEKQRIDAEKVYPVSVIMGDINGLKLINDSFGHLEGDKLIVSIANILQANCRETDILARTGGDEFSIILPNSTNDYAEEMVKKIEEGCNEVKKSTLGDVYRLSISLGSATKKSVLEPLTQAIKDAEDNMYRHKMLQSRSFHSSILSSMKTTLFEKNKETEEHAQRLIEYSNLIGQKLQLWDKQLNELELLSTLHDIGKIGISDLILNKPGRLSEEEWVEMKKHPEIGYRIAMSTSELAPIAEYILYHHERWDGDGYPQGLKGEEIPLLSRIISVADAYDAMTEDRPYRKAISREEACTELRRNAGSQFDPDIVMVFLKEIEKV